VLIFRQAASVSPKPVFQISRLTNLKTAACGPARGYTFVPRARTSFFCMAYFFFAFASPALSMTPLNIWSCLARNSFVCCLWFNQGTFFVLACQRKIIYRITISTEKPPPNSKGECLHSTLFTQRGLLREDFMEIPRFRILTGQECIWRSRS